MAASGSRQQQAVGIGFISGARGLAIAAGLLLGWQLLVWVTGAPAYILPGPVSVVRAWVAHAGTLIGHAGVTATEIVLGLIAGTLFGVASALSLTCFRRVRRWLLPVLVISQSLPVFALAPILVLWLGYGLASKVAMATLIIYFPVTAACYDGLRHTEAGWIDLARTMNGSPRAILRYIRLPAAVPALASGLRVATAVAPIGAVVGEWVGSSRGLGFLMLHANGRMQIDLMFAALLTLAVMSVALYYTVNRWLTRMLYWHPESLLLTESRIQ